MAYEHSQGIAFTFDGQLYTATSISVQRSRGELDATTIEMEAGSFRRLRSGRFPDVTINVECLGSAVAVVGKTSSFAITGAIAPWASTQQPGFSNVKAACTSFSVNAQAGDLIRCSGTFKLSNEDY